MDKPIYHPEFVKNLFNKMSSSYERMNYITSFGFSIRWRRQLLNFIKPIDGNVMIIDLLTGMGETWSGIKRHYPDSTLTVLDFSEGMLHYAKRKNEDKFNNEIIVLQQDILQNTLPNNHYDLVTCAFGLKTFNSEQLSILAKETQRILKPGGQFTFIEVSKPENKILNFFYGFYLGKVIPILGTLFLGSPTEYKLLWKYTSGFVNAQKVSHIFTQAGLSTEFVSYFYGCASGFYGSKRDD